jgi:hypothetical protein
MANYYYPDADISAGSWTYSAGSTLYECVDDAPIGGTDYISSSTNSDQCILGLPDIVDPGVDTDHVLSISAKCGRIASIDIELIEDPSGTPTVIDSLGTTSLTRTVTEYYFTVDPSSITDYTDLGVRITAYMDAGNGPAYCYSVQFELPSSRRIFVTHQ